jgi:hypothetical protein
MAGIIYNWQKGQDMKPRIGNFCILIGSVLILVFIGSVFSKETKSLYLLYGTVAFIFGFLLKRRRTPLEPTRFSSIRKARQRSRERKDNLKLKSEKRKLNGSQETEEKKDHFPS